MIRLNKKEIQQNFELIPEKKGIFIFSDSHETYLTGITSNLRKKIKLLFTQAAKDTKLFQLLSRSEKIDFETGVTFLELIKKKKIIDLQYNVQYKSFENYCYLGIDFYKVPYFKICEDTQNDLFYIGPFRNRFFVYDFLQIMNELFSFPVCENEQYPCHLFKEKRCRGWCIDENDKLQKMISDNYLNINNNLLNQLKKKQNELFNDLQFNEAQIIKKKLEYISKYYEFLTFFKITKKINIDFDFNNTRYFVKKGQLIKINENKQTEYFQEDLTEFRDNEKYAVNKAMLDEMWIIYQHLKKENLINRENI